MNQTSDPHANSPTPATPSTPDAPATTPGAEIQATPAGQPAADSHQAALEGYFAHNRDAGKGPEIFDEQVTFANLGLRSSVLKGVEALGFKYPTIVQAKLIPQILSGKDVIGQAKTGTGKTAAFGLPLLHACNAGTPFQALVLAPTRELALQIAEEIRDLGQFTPIKPVTVYGGQAIRTQSRNLQRGGEIIVGTPGRVLDMHERGLLPLDQIRFAVLDEVDRMLDIGFRDDIRRILDKCPPPGQRQSIFVSATISGEIEKLARRHMRDPEKIVTSAGSLTVSLVEQYHLTVQPWDKTRLLIHLLKHEEPALTLVFCRLKRTVDEVATALTKAGIEAFPMHGDMSQGKRNSTMKRLREGELACLIASDLASRGLDVEGISHVINYDLPEDPEIYVHRIGRTARAGRRGIAWSFVTPKQGGLLTDIEVLINAEIPKLDYGDFTTGDKPQSYRDHDAPAGLRIDLPEREAAPKVNRIQAAANLQVPAAVDPSKFPGGVVPTKMPPKRIFGRIPSSKR
jgi:ATP-dependent RNA helicase DeaD